MTNNVAEKVKPQLNPALKSFWLQKARGRVLFGGRSSSKSWDAAGFSVFLAANYKLRILCVRQHQNKIAESVYTLLKIQIERFGLRSLFKILNNKIISITGSEFMFYGLARNIDEIKSIESIDILWIEEAHSLTEEQWLILEPTIRKENSEIWIIFNPLFATNFSYERFVLNPPADFIVRKINYDENPFLSQTMLKVIEAAKGQPWFNHVYLGHPRDGDVFFSLDSLLVDGKPVEPTLQVDGVYAVIDSAIKTGKEHDGTAVVYFALSKHWGHPLMILDWDIVQIEGALLETWLPTVYENLEALSKQYRARMGSIGVWIEDKASGMILLQQARRRGWQAEAIDSKLTSVGKDERAISVSGYVYRGMCKITKHAYDKTTVYKGASRNHLLSQVSGFRPADKTANTRADDLLDCFTYGVAIGLGNNEGF